jgi:hypothetical protein
MLDSEVLEDGKRISVFLPRDGLGKRGAARLHAIPFTWRQHRGGALIHVQDVDQAFRLCEAAERLMAVRHDRSNFLQQLAEVLGWLHVRAGRLYRRDSRTDKDSSFDALRPIDAFDLDDPDRVLKFRALKDDLCFRNVGRDAEVESWRCFRTGSDGRAPLGRATAFGYYPNLEDGVRTNPLGLEFINIREPLFNRPAEEIVKNPGRHKMEVFRKQENRNWIDIPLRCNDKIFGKMTLDCDPLFGPEQFAIVSGLAIVLAEMASDILTIFFAETASRVASNELKLVLAEARAGIMDKLTTLSELISPLAVLFAKYKRRGEQFPEIQPLNAEFEMVYNRLRSEIAVLSSAAISKCPEP